MIIIIRCAAKYTYLSICIPLIRSNWTCYWIISQSRSRCAIRKNKKTLLFWVRGNIIKFSYNFFIIWSNNNGMHQHQQKQLLELIASPVTHTATCYQITAMPHQPLLRGGAKKKIHPPRSAQQQNHTGAWHHRHVPAFSLWRPCVANGMTQLRGRGIYTTTRPRD